VISPVNDLGSMVWPPVTPGGIDRAAFHRERFTDPLIVARTFDFMASSWWTLVHGKVPSTKTKASP